MNGILKNIFLCVSFLALFKNTIASMPTSAMLSSTLSIAFANSSYVIPEEEVHTFANGRLFYDLHALFQLFDFVQRFKHKIRVSLHHLKLVNVFDLGFSLAICLYACYVYLIMKEISAGRLKESQR